MQPLEGIRVVELANNLAGAYAGRLLAGYGADVIKIESASNNAVREEAANEVTRVKVEQRRLEALTAGDLKQLHE